MCCMFLDILMKKTFSDEAIISSVMVFDMKII